MPSTSRCVSWRASWACLRRAEAWPSDTHLLCSDSRVAGITPKCGSEASCPKGRASAQGIERFSFSNSLGRSSRAASLKRFRTSAWLSPRCEDVRRRAYSLVCLGSSRRGGRKMNGRIPVARTLSVTYAPPPLPWRSFAHMESGLRHGQSSRLICPWARRGDVSPLSPSALLASTGFRRIDSDTRLGPSGHAWR